MPTHIKETSKFALLALYEGNSPVTQRPNWQYGNIGSDNGLAPNRRQAIIWDNDGIGYQRVYELMWRLSNYALQVEDIIAEWLPEVVINTNKSGLNAEIPSAA